MPTFGQKLKKIRSKEGLQQKDLGKILGCAEQRICEWENERRIPKPLTQEGAFIRIDKYLSRRKKK